MDLNLRMRDLNLSALCEAPELETTAAKLPQIGRGIGKIAIAQIACDGARIEENLAKILECISNAKQQAVDLLVFPELSIPGYLAMDWFYDEDFLAQNRAALETIIEASDGIAIVVGFADQDTSKRAPGNLPWVYNAAAIIKDQQLLGVQHKRLLPNYNIFEEMRWFQPGESQDVVEVNGIKIGVAICEDLWRTDHQRDIAGELVASGAELLVALNASPYNEGKFESRYPVMTAAAREHNTPLIWVNLVGCGDAYHGELIFDGHSFVIDENGEAVLESPSFSECMQVLELDKKITSHAVETRELAAEEFDALVMALRQTCQRRGFKKLIIGVSGGIDSAVSAALAVEAIGAENVIGVTMPSHVTSEETYSDALELADNLGFKCLIRPITREFEAWVESTREFEGREPGRIARHNWQSSLRGNILLRISNDEPNSAVLNNGNRNERLWGYFTLGGDSEGALATVSDCWKSDIWDIAKHYNAICAASGQRGIPPSIIERPPTAELEPGQTDVGSLGVDYDTSDLIDRHLVEKHTPADELVEMFGVDLLKRAEDALQRFEGKGRQLPGGFRLKDRGYGHQRRIPMDHTFRKWKVATAQSNES